MKKILLSLLLFGLFQNLIFASDDSAKYNINIKVARIKKLDDTLVRVVAIKEHISQYIIKNGDIYPTKDKMKNLNINWKGFSKKMDFTLSNDGIITIGPVYDYRRSNKESSLSIYYKNKPHPILDENLAKIDRRDPNKITIPLNAAALSYIEVLKYVEKKVDEKKIIKSNTTPTNYIKDGGHLENNITFYRLKGDSTIELYRYDENNTYGKNNSHWRNLGLIGDKLTLKSMGHNECIGVFGNEELINGVVALDLTCAIIYTNESLRKYAYIEKVNKWVLTLGVIAKYEILHMAKDSHPDVTLLRNDRINKNELYSLSTVHNEFTGGKKFILNNKITKFWIADKGKNKTYIVAGTISQLNNAISNSGKGSIAYILNKTQDDVYLLRKRNIPLVSGQINEYVYEAYGYRDILERFSATDFKFNIGNLGKYIYDEENHKYFVKIKKDNKIVFKSLDGAVQLTKDTNARGAFEPTENNNITQFFTLTNDCTESTCYGQEGSYYNFNEQHKLFLFSYIGTGNQNIKNKNKLTNMIKEQCYQEMYDNKNPLILLECDDNKAYRIDQKASQETNGTYSYGYHRLEDGVYYTNKGNEVPIEFIENNGSIQLPNKLRDGKIFNLYSDGNSSDEKLFKEENNIKSLNAPNMTLKEIIQYTNAPNNIKINTNIHFKGVYKNSGHTIGAKYVKNKIFIHVKKDEPNYDYWSDCINELSDKEEYLDCAYMVLANNEKNFPVQNFPRRLRTQRGEFNNSMILTLRDKSIDDLNEQDNNNLIHQYHELRLEHSDELLKWVYIHDESHIKGLESYVENSLYDARECSLAIDCYNLAGYEESNNAQPIRQAEINFFRDNNVTNKIGVKPLNKKMDIMIYIPNQNIHNIIYTLYRKKSRYHPDKIFYLKPIMNPKETLGKYYKPNSGLITVSHASQKYFQAAVYLRSSLSGNLKPIIKRLYTIGTNTQTYDFQAYINYESNIIENNTNQYWDEDSNHFKDTNLTKLFQ
jgi:hypothetical protein